MAQLYPFRGFRYNRRLIDDFNGIVAQPYDKTTPAMQEEYYERSPYNVVRITLNREKNSETDTLYPEAGAIFRRWIEQEVLIRDRQPSFYPYYQEYTFENRTQLQRGFIGLLDLKDTESSIIPHEHTLAAPKRDRFHLIRSIEGNEDLIYLLYNDRKHTVDRLMDQGIAGQAPQITVTDEYGVIHRVWAITDPDLLTAMQDCMRNQDLFIADGHHRFETSVMFMNECEHRGWRPAEPESFDKRMVACINSASGVTILATHRLLRDLPSFDAAAFLNDITAHFTVERLSTAEELWRKMKALHKNHVFGFYAGNSGSFRLLHAKSSALETGSESEHGDAFRKLDVSILHSLILERHLGIDEHKLASQAYIDYERERDTCIQKVNEGSHQAAFFLNPTTAEQMQHIASAGQRMPQKSTDFFPKLLTGLVFMKMQIEKP
ncbi:MAG TPA: DUF1015 domain-containing protein [Acidobacteriota bacterium]|nr:DUF1015 domain-containing protein [Acidobacteriota bacterium]